MAEKVDDGYPPQGWYPDPEDSSYLRRWDGAAWTDERVPASRGRRRLRAHDHPGTVSSGADSSADVSSAGATVVRGVSDSDDEHPAAPAPAVHDLDAELARRQTEIDRLVEREEGLTRAVEDRRAEIEHIAEREEELVQRIGDARAELARIEEQVAAGDAAQERLAELTAAEAAATGRLEQRRAELTEFDREMVEAQRVAEAELEGLRAAVEETRQDSAAAAAHAEETARQLEELTRRREDLAREHDELARAHETLTREHEALTDEHKELAHRHAGAVAEYEELGRLHEELAGLLETRRAELAEVEAGVAAARTELVDLGERVAAQDLGLYDYRHPAEDSVALATQLAALRETIVETLRSGGATTAPKNFKLGHSAAKGQQVLAEVTALSLRAYNAEAENAVRTAGPGGIDGALTRLIRARDAVARHGAWIGVTITDRYHALRAQEIEIAGEYKIRKEREEAAAAAAPAARAPLPPEYVPGGTPAYGTDAPGYGTGAYGAGPGYTPGASGYVPGEPGYTPGGVVSGPASDGGAPDPAPGTPGWEPPSPVSTNGRYGH